MKGFEGFGFGFGFGIAAGVILKLKKVGACESEVVEDSGFVVCHFAGVFGVVVSASGEVEGAVDDGVRHHCGEVGAVAAGVLADDVWADCDVADDASVFGFVWE